MDSLQALKKYWGYKAFRPLQQEIIQSVLEGKDTVALLPTGGGKSICYQIPAVIGEGITLVISPLIALMEDQVLQLNERGIKAMMFRSDPKVSLSQQLDNSIYGGYRLLYTAPERLLNKEFLKRISQNNISLIAVDESHCISEWGHDFRPAYRKIHLLREIFPKIPLLALTASATPKVLGDIQGSLALRKATVFRTSFERKNIAYQIVHTADKLGCLERIFKESEESSIIYCRSRNETEQIKKLLDLKGVNADYFHGGLSNTEKKEKLLAWQREEVKVIVATTAFGMGIDKENVRTVIHLSLAESLESYYQESGRAGRDGKPSKALLLLQEGDADQVKNQFLKFLPDGRMIVKCYKHLCNYFQIAMGEGSSVSYSLDFKSFCKTYGLNLKTVMNCFSALEREGVFAMNFLSSDYCSISIKAAQLVVLSYVEKSSPGSVLLQYIVRTFTDAFSKDLKLHFSEAAKVLNVSEKTIRSMCETLQSNNMILTSEMQKNIEFVFLEPRDDRQIKNVVAPKIVALNTTKAQKIKTMIAFAFNNKECKRNQLLAYFGECKDGTCGQCSSLECQAVTPKIGKENIEERVISSLQESPKTARELKQDLLLEEDELANCLALLQESQIIRRMPNHRFEWIR